MFYEYIIIILFFLFKEMWIWGGVLLEFDRKGHKKEGRCQFVMTFFPLWMVYSIT